MLVTKMLTIYKFGHKIIRSKGIKPRGDIKKPEEALSTTYNAKSIAA